MGVNRLSSVLLLFQELQQRFSILKCFCHYVFNGVAVSELSNLLVVTDSTKVLTWTLSSDVLNLGHFSFGISILLKSSYFSSATLAFIKTFSSSVGATIERIK